MAALMIGEDQLAALARLRQAAAAAPIDMQKLLATIATPDGKAAHKARAQSVEIPFGYLVTFSIETGHPCGTARHMSMSTSTPGRIPIPAAIWMVAEPLGFTGRLDDCVVWIEELDGHGSAVNVVQPLGRTETAGTETRQ